MIFNIDFYEVFIPPNVLIWISCLVSFILTFIAIPSIVRVSTIKNLVALPNGRTSHKNPTPNLGGVAIFAGVVISSVLFTGINTAHELKYIIAAMMIIFFIGLKDDLYPIAAYKKFIGQTLAILFILIPGGSHIQFFHGLFGIYEISYFPSLIISYIFFLAMINSFNLIDGIDGLSSGIGILTSIFFAIVFLMDNQLPYAIMSFILASSLLAFFYFNVFSKRNKIFLGDTGAMLIGLVLAIFAVRFLNEDSVNMFFKRGLSAPAALLAVLIVPLFDTARVFVLRIAWGKSPFEADRNHIHHRLLELSGNHLKATSIILLVNILMVSIVSIFRDVGTELLIGIILALAAILSYIPVYLKKRKSDKP